MCDTTCPMKAVSVSPLLELASMTMNEDLCGQLLLSHDPIVCQRTSTIVVDIIRGTLSNKVCSDIDVQLVRLLFKRLLLSMPLCLLRRCCSVVYFELLQQIMSIAIEYRINIFDKSGDGDLSAIITETDFVDALCVLLIICPTYEAKTEVAISEDVNNIFQDNTFVGIANLLVYIIRNSSNSYYDHVGILNDIVPFLVKECLFGKPASVSNSPMADMFLPSHMVSIIHNIENENEEIKSLAHAILQHSIIELAAQLHVPHEASMSEAIATSLSQQASVRPKAKTQASRAACLTLLKTLCTGSTNAALSAGELLIRLETAAIFPMAQMVSASPSDIFAESFKPLLSSRDGRIRGLGVGVSGIANPSALCYIISVVQQLFAMESLRMAVLALPLHKLNSDVDNRAAIATTAELQVLFARMQYSHSSNLSIDGLIGTLLRKDGTSIDVSEQRDAVEIMGKLLTAVDKVGALLCHRKVPESGGKSLFLKDLLSGQLAVEFKAVLNEAMVAIASTGGAVSADQLQYTRYEDFYFLGGKVSEGIDSMQGALSKSIFDSVDVFPLDWAKKLNLNSFDKAEMRLNTEKRTRLHSMPDTLMVHLQRYEFNYETMSPIKLLNRVSFPDHLTFHSAQISTESPVTHSYELSGVLVHEGTAQDGHYKSYIRMNNLNGTDPMLCEDSTWLQLRDMVVAIGQKFHINESHGSVNFGLHPATETIHSLTAMLTSREKPVGTAASAPPERAVHTQPESWAHLLHLLEELQELSKTENEKGESEDWLEFNDDKILTFNKQRMPEVAFGLESDDTLDKSARQKKENKKKRNKELKSGKESPTAMVVVYKQRGKGVLDQFVSDNIDTVLKLIEKINLENAYFWTQRHHSTWPNLDTSTGILDWLYTDIPKLEDVTATKLASLCQINKVNRIVMEYALRTSSSHNLALNISSSDFVDITMLPSTAHWLLSFLSNSDFVGRSVISTLVNLDDVSNNNVVVPKLRVAIQSLVLNALHIALSINPLLAGSAAGSDAGSAAVGRDHVHEKSDSIVSFTEFANVSELESALRGSSTLTFCNGNVFVSNLLNVCGLVPKCGENIDFNFVWDCLEICISRGIASHVWLTSARVIELLLSSLCGMNAEDILVTDSKATHLAVISVGTDMARQRQAAKLLSQLMKSKTVSGRDKYSKDMWSDNEDDNSDTTTSNLNAIDKDEGMFVSLSEREKSLLLHPLVITRLILLMECHAGRVSVGVILSSLLTNSKPRTEILCTALQHALTTFVSISTSGADTSSISGLQSRSAFVRRGKSIFRTVLIMCAIADRLADWRIHVCMSALLHTVQEHISNLSAEMLASADHTVPMKQFTQNGPWILLEIFITMLPRFCRLVPSVKTWLDQNEGCLQSAQFSVELLHQKFPAMQSSVTEKMFQTLQLLQSIFTFSEKEGVYIDSDDEPSSLVNRRVVVTWSRGRKYKGKVSAYHANTCMHDVRYDDNDLKSYVLCNSYSARSVAWELEDSIP